MAAGAPHITLFDTYVIVDWSANARPNQGTDSVWISHRCGLETAQVLNPPTRAKACAELTELLCNHGTDGQRMLVGFDFPYGYSSGFASAMGLPDSPGPWSWIWRLLAAEIRDAPDNSNNRFEVARALNRRTGSSAGPFWGSPVGSSLVPQTSPTFPFHTATGRVLNQLSEGKSQAQ
jgi:precorrin-8X/cobalt-precorrin-8 methylmutase